ncbi:hypothetical protein [Caulobacter sp. 17J65-9]|uniref:hypothetical protein n=1 Tax=Caulobacter sp. 17J65-9 TaxID=2709382 RepID=UPI0013CD57B0|nr:hypothetical protein [Caulobacter sp. 17J65-9]NEX95200.1 hypothetical protein [Caulobacter sp. 17J65-9]
MVWDVGLAPTDPAAEFVYGHDYIGGVTHRTRFSIAAVKRAFPSAEITREDWSMYTDSRPARREPRIRVRAPGVDLVLGEAPGGCVGGATIDGARARGPVNLPDGAAWRDSGFAPADCRTEQEPFVPDTSVMSCGRPGESDLRYWFAIPAQDVTAPPDLEHARFTHVVWGYFARW